MKGKVPLLRQKGAKGKSPSSSEKKKVIKHAYI
jgi:hypothetical protein